MRVVQGLGAASTRVIATAVVRDRFSGRAMAEVMSLAFMVFMVIPVVAPSIGEVLLIFAPWQSIFLFMGLLALAFGAVFELPILVLALTSLGLVTPATLKRFRRHSLVLCVVVAAFVWWRRRRTARAGA